MQRTRVSCCHLSGRSRPLDRCMLPDAQHDSFTSLQPAFQQQRVESSVVDTAVDAANPRSLVSRANCMTPGYSRSASVVSSIVGRQDEDISSIMMRGATDLRNAKFEIEEQVCHHFTSVSHSLTACFPISVGKSHFFNLSSTVSRARRKMLSSASKLSRMPQSSASRRAPRGTDIRHVRYIAI